VPEQLVTVLQGQGQGQGEKGETLKTYTCADPTTFCREAKYAKPEKPQQPINVFPTVTSASAAAGVSAATATK
jgi:hypothetical protein